jgi:sugar phosphate isomerase/epimerase
MIFWWREHYLSLEQECEFLRMQGFGVELWPHMRGNSECRYRRKNWPRLAYATKNMLVSMRSRNDDPDIEQWIEQIECAKLLDANIITDTQSLRAAQDTNSHGLDFAADVVKIADENHVKICLETGTLSTLIKVAEKFDSLRFCLDIGHANIDPSYSFREYVDELSPRVAHLHLTDNYGQFDDHEPPGLRGGISRKNWDYLLETLNKYDNDIIGSFEMYPCMPATMIRQASEFLFEELNWPNKPQKQPGHANLHYNPT